jgi:NifB/MoaA-like Fe-S oxidoreductase
VEDFARKCKDALGAYLFHASDEFYLKAGLPLPAEARYEGYPQLENGVGMLTSFRTDFRYALADTPKQGGKRSVTVATGRAAYPLLSALAKEAEEKFDGLSVRVVCVENEFFGPEITVAGLLTGEDYLRALKGTPLGDALLISRTSLRAEGDLFLCGASLDALSEALGVPVIPVENDGFAFLAALLGNA